MTRPTSYAKPSALVDTRVIYGGDSLEQLQKLPDACVDFRYIDSPFISNRNYEVIWGKTKEKRAFEDHHGSTQAYLDFMRPRCVELARVLKKTGSFYYHCDWHAATATSQRAERGKRRPDLYRQGEGGRGLRAQQGPRGWRLLALQQPAH